MTLKGELEGPKSREATSTLGHAGKNAGDIKTAETEVDPAQYIEELDTRRRIEHGRLLLGIFNRVTGEGLVMWGPSTIGYRKAHYKYATGREGDTFRLGFSPRKAKISLYGLSDSAEAPGLLVKLRQVDPRGVLSLYQ